MGGAPKTPEKDNIMDGYIHSVQSFSTLDGPGIRSVVFMSGCPLRCQYCHNPDTWNIGGERMTPRELVNKLARFLPYTKKGGVTFSGGEPLMQAEFISDCAALLKEYKLHIAIDTSGAVYNDSVIKLLNKVDLALLDVKFTTEEDYRKYTGGSLETTLHFLERLDRRNIPTWIRHVVVPGINDNAEDVLKLKELVRPYSVVKQIDLLPFSKLCVSKYEKLGLDFPLKDTPELDNTKLRELEELLK